jgi:phosphate/sulfate permease
MMTTLADIGGSRLVLAAEWVAKPFVAGVVALVFFVLQRRMTRLADEERAVEAAAKAEREANAHALATLRAEIAAVKGACDIDRAKSEAAPRELSARIDALDREVKRLHDRVETIHDTWNNRHADLMGGIHEAQTDISQVRERLSALESSHAANHGPLRS